MRPERWRDGGWREGRRGRVLLRDDQLLLRRAVMEQTHGKKKILIIRVEWMKWSDGWMDDREDGGTWR